MGTAGNSQLIVPTKSSLQKTVITANKNLYCSFPKLHVCTLALIIDIHPLCLVLKG